jgi:hypothetical protein
MRGAVLLLLAALSAPAEIIDGIAATIDRGVITRGEVRLNVRLTAFLNGEPAPEGEAASRDAMERLIEQFLIRREVEDSRYPFASIDDARQMLADFVRMRFGGDAARYQAALEEYGLNEDDVLAELRWQITALRFIDVRFGSGIQIRSEDIQAYFQQEVLAKFRAEGDPPRLTDELAEQISETLLRNIANEGLEAWLRETRGRSAIDIRPELRR